MILATTIASLLQSALPNTSFCNSSDSLVRMLYDEGMPGPLDVHSEINDKGKMEFHVLLPVDDGQILLKVRALFLPPALCNSSDSLVRIN